MVQLLYFLPKMSQPLLANLSSCCTAGRISAGLAASLIRIIHLRWAFRPALESTWTQLCLTADGCWHTGTQTTLCLITIRWQCCSFTDKSVTAFMIYYLLVDINWDEYSVFLIFNFLVTIKPLFFFLLYFVLLSSPVNLSLWWYVCAAMFDLILMSVGQCYTNFEWWEYWVHMGWSVCTGVCVCLECCTKSSFWGWNAGSSWSIEKMVCMCLPGFMKHPVIHTHFSLLQIYIPPQGKEEVFIIIFQCAVILNILENRRTLKSNPE